MILHQKKSALLYIILSMFIHAVVVSAENLPENKLTNIEEVCTARVCVAEKIKFYDSTLILRGHELFRYFFFRIYIGSFYTENPVSELDSIFDIPGDKYLRLEYLRSIKAEDFISSSEDALKNNPLTNPEEIRKELDTLYSAYEDIKKGDSYSLYFTDNTTTTCLFKNNVRKVCIEGEAFARAYFSIWLSEHSLNNEFSKKLISRR
jgi:hypothetical protein